MYPFRTQKIITYNTWVEPNQWADQVLAKYPRIRDHIVWPMEDSLKLEAAMILWETVDAWTGHEDTNTKWAKHRENEGTVALRHQVMSLVVPLHIAWGAHNAYHEDSGCFDWEFTPEFLKCFVSVGDGHLSLRDGWLDHLIKHGLTPMETL